MLSLPRAFSSGPQTSTRGLKTRSQPSLDAKERFCKNACFPSGKQRFFEGRGAKHIPLFRSEAATASHQDGNKLTESLGNTPSALNAKQQKMRFLIFLLSSLFSLLSSLCPRSRQRSHQGPGWPIKGLAPLWRRHLGTFGGLFGGLFSRLSSLFALRSSLFSLLSSPCRRGLVRPRSHESNHPLDS